MVVAAIAFAVAGCGFRSWPSGSAYGTPEALDDGWEVGSLKSEGLETSGIAELTRELGDGAYGNVHSFLVVRNGVLVHEAYFRGHDRERTHKIYSVTKSVSSALLGIAIGNGDVAGVHELISALLPEYVGPDWDGGKNRITLEHLLTHTAGLRWDEQSVPYEDQRNSHNQMSASSDWVKFVLDEPLVAEPGTTFVYSTGGSHLLAKIIRQHTGLDADTFADEHLFGPLSVRDYGWVRDSQGFPCTGGSFGGLSLRPRDMAKFGQLYLRRGEWEGEQIVPREWVAQSIEKRVAVGGDVGYGYLWWTDVLRSQGSDIELISAGGYGDQAILLFPALDMVVVFTSGNEGSGGQLERPIEMVLAAVP